MPEISLLYHLKLPVRCDGMSYIWDAASHMVADTNGILGDDISMTSWKKCRSMATFAATALNAAYGFAKWPQPMDGIVFPLRFVDDGQRLIDSAGQMALRIRGWGRLQHLGHDEAVAAQKVIGAAFAEAMNIAACRER
ncbi:MAG: hypothetical protein WC483_03875 [Candidatus Paceibacterota bacterium]